MGFLYFLSHKSVINDLNIIKMGDSPFLFIYFFFFFLFFFFLFIYFFRKLYNIQQSIENSIRRVHDLSQSRASGARQTLRLSMSSFFVENYFNSTDRSKAVVLVFVLLFAALWFILRDDLFYVLPCVILFLCFSVLLALRLPRFGKRELI